MSIADKLTLANNNVPKVYDAGNITTYSDDLYLSERTIIGTLDEPISELYVKSDEYSKNLIPYPYKDSSGTAGGITITINDDGTITVNGTASADRTFTIAQYTIQSGTYTLSGTKNGSLSTYYMGISGTSCRDVGNGSSVTFDTETTILIYISIKSGATLSNVVFKPQLELGSIATEYEQYHVMTNPTLTFSISSKTIADRTVTIPGTFSYGVETPVIVDLNTFDGTTVMSSDIPFKCKTALRKEKLCVNRPYIDTSSITDFSYFCYANSRNDFTNLLDTSNGTNFLDMFLSSSKLTSIPQLNTSKGINFRQMFSNCSSLTTIPKLNTGNGTNFSYMFDRCSSLITITLLDISNGTDFSYMFNGCTALQNITFTGTINASISFSSSSALTEASLKSIINALAVKPSSTCQLTLNSASWTLLDSITAPTGYSTWKEYISTYKGWTYA